MSTPASPTLSISSTPLASFQHASVSTPSIGAGSGSMSTAPHTAGGQHRRQNGGIPPPPPAYSTVHSPTRSSSLNRLQPRSTPPPPSSASSSHTPALSSTPVPPTDPPQTPLSTSSTASSYSRRVWVPTPNVPMRLQDRHHVHRVSPLTGQDEERNRWLSEDEGANSGVEGGSSRRRRRRQRSIPDQSACHDEPSNTHIPPGLPAASLDLRRPAFDARDRIKNQIAASSSPSTSPKPAANRSSRPIIRRAMSHEPQVSRSLTPATPIGAVDVTVGAFPPQIQDIVPTPGSPVRRFSVETKISPSARGSLQSAELVASTSGVQQTTESDGDDLMSERERRRAARHSTLETLQRILSCPLCSPSDGQSPTLHHPVTLPCGHTMSSSHIHFPAVPPLESISDLPHEIYAAQQRQHQQRLNHWSSVMCPIPTCKRYSPIAADTILRSDVSVRSDDSNRSRSSGSPAETLASGVLYYPPPSALPAYTAEIPIRMEPNTLLLDITVDKILNLVKTELKTPFSEDAYDRSSHRSHAEYEDDSDDSEAEAGPSGSAAMHTSLSRDMSNLGQPSGTSSSHRNKRQRGALRPVGSPDEWPFRRDLQSVIECDVCAMMLFDPVTTPCQHSFCYKCLSRSLDHSNRCPVCRQDLPGFAFFQDHSVNRVLLAVIKTVFKDAYAERQLAIEREERDALLDTPIFVCTLAFPGMPTILHVFEPRYRLMIRRCIESSSPRFGMVLPSHGTGQPGTQGVMEYGTMLEIQSVQMLPDGRSMVETVGSYRFKLLEKGNLDGYTVGRIERIDDITPAEELALEQSSLASSSEDHTALGLATDAILDAGGPTTTPAFGLASSGGAIPMPPLTQSAIDDETRSTEEYMTICRSFIDQLRSGSAPWLLQRLNNTYGTMPTDPSEFSYWMALVMPIDEYEKAKLLPIRSPRLRLKLIVHWVESLRSSWWFSSGCVVG